MKKVQREFENAGKLILIKKRIIKTIVTLTIKKCEKLIYKNQYRMPYSDIDAYKNMTI